MAVAPQDPAIPAYLAWLDARAAHMVAESAFKLAATPGKPYTSRSRAPGLCHVVNSDRSKILEGTLGESD